MHDLVIRGRRVAVPRANGGVEERAAAVWVTGGVIAAVTAVDADEPAAQTLDVGADVVLLPGLVDTHVHVNEPGRADWEGFASATRAAALGGTTTVVDMPLNSVPPTTTAAHLVTKQAAAAGQCHVDAGFYGGAVAADTGALKALHAAGVLGFKCFLVASGVEEFPALDASALREVMAELAGLGATLLVHAEDPGAIDRAATGVAGADPRRYATYLASRPDEAEVEAVAAVIAAAADTGCRAHIVHLSSAAAVPLLRDARARGVPITVETCPHYLALAAEDVADGATPFKCAPPIRGHANRDALWDGLFHGVIDAVVSDHSPCPPDLKRLDDGDFLAAWGGIASLQLRLPVVWTEAARRGVALAKVVDWLASGPARLVGLHDRKGAIAAGRDADLALFDPDATWTVRGSALAHRHPTTPYEGHELRGVVRATWLRGVPVGNGSAPAGRLLTRMVA